MATTVTYKGQTLATVENQTKTLQTAGTWCEDDFTLTDVTQGGGSEYEDSLVRRTGTYYRNDNVTTVGASAFRDYSSLLDIYLPNVTSIDNSGFTSCHGLTTINDAQFPKLENVNADAFRYSQNIASIFLSKLTASRNSCFANLYKNKTVVLPAWVGTSGNSGYEMFQDNRILESVDLGVNSARIYQYMFRNCNKLGILVIRSASVCPLNNADAFDNTPMKGYNSQTATIYVPSNLIESYKTASNWSTIYGLGFVTFSAIEGSQYETHYADGTVIA